MRTLLILMLAVLAGCGTAPVAGGLSAAEEAWLLQGASLRAGDTAAEPMPDDTVLALTPEMKRFAEDAVKGHGNDRHRINALLTALVSPGLLGITYDATATLTPAETFRQARANCLSFTMLYVLLARHVGLRADFNEVDVPPIWEMQGPATLLLYRHVNALVRPARDRRQVVDLDMEEYDTSYPQRQIPDRVAEAQYYNNRAMEFMFAGDLAEAQRHMAKALSVDPTVSYFWGNLGSLYWRAGDLKAAELAFRKAMQVSPVDAAAISNAARLYAQLGRAELAQQLEEQVANHRRRNPYYQYQQGLNAFIEGDYESARSHALAAIGAHDREHRFHFLLGAVYARLGDEGRARQSFDRAIELTSDDRQVALYRRKIDVLRRRSTDAPIAASSPPIPPGHALSSHGARAQVPDDIQARIARIEKALSADPAEADRLAAELLAVVPGHRIVLMLQGIARRLKGDAAAAVEVLQPLAAESPEAALVHLQLGLALREIGQNQPAAEALRKAVAVKPDYTSGWLALADLLTAMKDAQGADRAYAMYVRHAMQDPHIASAVAAVREKRLSDATSILNGLIRKFPNDVVALCTLADIAMHERRVPDAEMLLARCLELAPSYQAARHNYAVVLMRQDKLEDALREIDRLVLAEPGNPVLRNLKAAIHGRLGNHEQAINMYRGLLGQFPNQASTWSNLGHVLRTVGRRDECLEAYRKAIALSPEFGEAWWNLANLKTLQITDADLETMRAQVDKAGASDENRLHLHFAIGKALEDRKDFSGSFHHYSEGNRLRRKSAYYSADDTNEYVRRCKAVFTPGFFREREGCGDPAADPIFIVGLPRVGSTLVEQILSSHSAVEGTRELFNLSGIAMALGPAVTGLEEGRYPELLAGLERNVFRQLGRKYLEQTRTWRPLGRPFFIDKMPNNFSHTGFIHLTLPRARIIDIRRHPMACGWSLFKQLFARGQHFSYQLDEIGAHYRGYVELMAHFDDVLPGRVHRVHYESLVSDTEREVRRLLDYCGLPFEEACLNFHESRRAVSTPSSEQVRSRIFREAVDHWRNYEPWLGPLREALGPFADAYPEVPSL